MLRRMRAGLPPTEEPVESTSESETTPLTVSTPPGESFVCECREMEGSLKMQRLVKAPVVFLVHQVVQTLLLRVALMLQGMLVLLLVPQVVQSLLLRVAVILQGMLELLLLPLVVQTLMLRVALMLQGMLVLLVPLAVKVKIVLLLNSLSVKTRIICMSLIHLL